MPTKAGHRKPVSNPRWLRPGVMLMAGLLIVVGVAVSATANKLFAGSGPAARSSATPSVSPAAVRPSCPDLVVPAYFDANYWTRASATRPAPADMILDLPNGVGAGTAPDPAFQSLVRQAKSAGITILGYSSTVDGARPVADVEADVRHYKAWYGVTQMFLDRVSGAPAQFGYYQRISGYIHQQDPGLSVWMNPGDYPDQSYMSIGDVVMVFEGTYAQYLTLAVPKWAGGYPAARFAHTIYATPGTVLTNALSMAADRGAGHVYVTDLVGGNPYQALPSYWARESAASCGRA